ncbi:MAG: TolC family outer membrane protein [Inquilinus sp.]|nr:TolC family outer membrane protein [Inquilinus sp.]
MVERGRRRRQSAARVAIAAIGIALATSPAEAETLAEALVLVHQGNPTLAAQKSQLRAANEQIAQALSGYRPNVQAQGEYGIEYSDTELSTGTSDSDTVSPASVGITVNQPLYRGGRTAAGVRSADFSVQASRAGYLSVEQTVLLDAVAAYMDVVREEAVLELSINNEQVLRRQLQATRDRFSVGEVTRTDVSQAESRLARTTADRIAAQGDLATSRATYARIIGVPPGVVEAPPLPLGMPTSRAEAIALGEGNNPSLIAATFNAEAAKASVDVVFGEMLPQLDLSGRVRSTYEPSSTIDQSDSASLAAELTVPLYQSGAVSSRVREAKYAANESRIRVEEQRRTVVEAANRAWDVLVTARATIQSLLAQVNAARIALEGTRQEALVGSRTVLDVLDAEQELLDARVSLVRAQRDEVVAGYSLLAVVGRMTARELGLPVEYYDFEDDYRAARRSIWGTSIRE